MRNPWETSVRRPAVRRAGFTLVELVLACLIVTLIIGGVVTTLRMVVAVESAATTRWNDDAEASAAVDEIAGAVAAAVDLPGVPGLKAAHDEGAGRELQCSVTVGRGLERRRYAWGPAAALKNTASSNASASGDKLALTVQTLRFAGTQNLSLAPGARAPEPQQIFDAAEPVPIARRLDELTLSYRAVGSPATAWKDTWPGPAAGVLVRVRVRVGEVVAERIVRPGVTAPLGGGGGGGGEGNGGEPS